MPHRAVLPAGWRQRVRHPAVNLVAASFVTQLALVVSGPLVVRLVGVAGRGEFALIFTVVLIASQVGALGMPQAFVFYIAGRAAPPISLLRSYGGRYLALSLVAAAAGAATLALLSATRDPLTSPAGEIAIAAGGIVAIVWASLLQACLQGEHRFRLLARLQVIPSSFYAISVAVLFVADSSASPTLLIGLNLAGWVLAAAALLAAIRHQEDPGARPPRSIPPLRELASYGLRAAVAGANPTDGLSLDQLAIGVVLGRTDLGLYAIAYAFESAPVLALTAISSIAAPRVAAEPDAAKRRALGYRWLATGAAVAVVICGFVEVVLHPVLVAVFGHAAAPAVHVGRVLIVAGLFLGLRRVGSAVLQAQGQPGRSTVAGFVGVGVLVVGLATLIAPFGIVGAAWALTAAGFGCVVAQLFILRTLQRSVPVAAAHAE